MVSQPIGGQHAAIPVTSGVEKRQNPFTKNSSAITNKSGNTIKVSNNISGVS